MKTSKLSNLLTQPEIQNKPSKVKIELKTINIGDLIDAFNDGTTSFGERKAIFEELRRRDVDLARESITNLCRNYEHSGAKDLINFICFMLDYVVLDIFEKFECVLALHNSNNSNTRGYFTQILRDYSAMSKDTRPSITIFIDVLRYLLVDSSMSNQQNDEVVDHVKWFLNDSSLSTPFIYKTIISIQRDEDRKVQKNYLDCLYMEFFNSQIDPNHLILSAQYLLQWKLNVSEVESKLLSIAQSLDTTYNTRADSADLLIKMGSSSIREAASKIISELGRDMSSAPTLATNKQNVHLMDESVNKFLLILGGTKLDVITKDSEAERVIIFSDVIEIIKALPKYSNNSDEINSSLLRIKIDQLIYPGSQTLATIFIKIFQMIQKHSYKDMLMDRLIEELIEAANTCSSGHVSRLVNIFSGIDGFVMDIGFRNQIESNIAGRLNAKIKTAIDTQTRDNISKTGRIPDIEELNIIDVEYRNKISCEMINNQPEDRLSFNQFFRENIGYIRDEMYNEFVGGGHVTSDDFEMYIRQGLIFYETGHKEN